jgi:hypothetical protein
VPGARLVLQLDEPALPGVIAGAVRSASGLRRLAPPEAADIEARLGTVLSATAAFSVVHCCAKDVPFTVIKDAGAGAVGFDLAQLGTGGQDMLAEVAEAGLGILAGVLPATPPAQGRRPAGPGGARAAGGPATSGAAEPGRAEGRGGAEPGRAAGPGGAAPAAPEVAQRVVEVWQRMGWPAPGRGGRAAVAGQVVLTPACGLAGAPPWYAREVLARCRDAARLLPELAEEA